MASKRRKSLDFRAILDDLTAARDEILEETKPLQKKREALLKKIQPLEAELREINQQIKAIEFPALHELGKQISVLHGAINPNTRTLVNTGEAPREEPG